MFFLFRLYIFACTHTYIPRSRYRLPRCKDPTWRAEGLACPSVFITKTAHWRIVCIYIYIRAYIHNVVVSSSFHAPCPHINKIAVFDFFFHAFFYVIVSVSRRYRRWTRPVNWLAIYLQFSFRVYLHQVPRARIYNIIIIRDEIRTI